MSQTFTLSAQKRESSKNSARDTRDQARVPGIVYGHNVDPIMISVDNSDILRTYRKAGQSALIDLDINGKTLKVLIHEFVRHPIKDTIHHIDFYVVNLKEKTTVHVPLLFTGESLAIKNQGGVFMKDHDAIDLRCLPTEIPREIEVNISRMENIHDHLTIADLGLDEKFEVMHLDSDTVICSIAGRAAEEEEETPATTEGEAAEGEAAEAEEKSE